MRLAERTDQKMVALSPEQRRAESLSGCHAAIVVDFYKPVMICLFGGFHVDKEGENIPVHGNGKGAALLSLLALHYNTCLPRETIQDLLWPESTLELSAQSLNSLVYSLHRQLGDYINGNTPLLYCEGCYRLNLQSGIGIDILAFDNLAHQSEQLASIGDAAAAAVAARSAAAYYLGDIYSGSDLFATLERERLRSAYLTLLARLADYQFTQGDYAGCLDYAHRLLEFDPCREDAHRLLMRCHVRRGERAAALRQYHLCLSALHTEFDAAPEPATRNLFELIRTSPQSV